MFAWGRDSSNWKVNYFLLRGELLKIEGGFCLTKVSPAQLSLSRFGSPLAWCRVGQKGSIQPRVVSVGKSTTKWAYLIEISSVFSHFGIQTCWQLARKPDPRMMQGPKIWIEPGYKNNEKAEWDITLMQCLVGSPHDMIVQIDAVIARCLDWQTAWVHQPTPWVKICSSHCRTSKVNDSKMGKAKIDANLQNK